MYLSDLINDVFLEFLNIGAEAMKKLESTLENSTVIENDGTSIHIKYSVKDPSVKDHDAFIEEKLNEWTPLMNMWYSGETATVDFHFGEDSVQYKWFASEGKFFKVEPIRAEPVCPEVISNLEAPCEESVEFSENIDSPVEEDCVVGEAEYSSVAERIMNDIEHEHYAKCSADDIFDAVKKLLDDRRYSWRRSPDDTVVIITYKDILSVDFSISALIENGYCDFLHLKNRIMDEIGFGDVRFIEFPNDSATIELRMKQHDKIFS